MEARGLRTMSLEDYLALDRSDEARWEYVNGAAWAMAGATPEHNLVVRNIVVALTNSLRGRDCWAMPDGQKLVTAATRGHHYPDAIVLCGDARFDRSDEHGITNPTLLVEVSSPSTADYDRGGKFAHYRSLESLLEYVIVDPSTRTVEHHRKLEPGQWLLTELGSGPVELPSIGVSLAWDDLWIDLDRLQRSRDASR